MKHGDKTSSFQNLLGADKSVPIYPRILFKNLTATSN